MNSSALTKSLFLSFLCFTISWNVYSSTPDVQSEAKTLNDPSLLQKVESWYEENINYASITGLMVIESSFIPFPSEIVIPPAAYIASKPESHLNIILVVLFGTLGAIIGALINYYLALFLGRKIVYAFVESKVGHLFLLNAKKMEKAEAYFLKKGNISTFIGRLIPGIRQLISIPAGISKMKLGAFLLYTTLGALIWNIILAVLGYLAHGQKELIDQYSHEISLVILICLVLFASYFLFKFLFKRRKSIKNKKEIQG